MKKNRVLTKKEIKKFKKELLKWGQVQKAFTMKYFQK